MKVRRASQNKFSWPRHKVESVDCRKRDLVIRISDWGRDKDEPAFDVECYIGGVYDWHESQTFTVHEYKRLDRCKTMALAFAQAQIAKLA